MKTNTIEKLKEKYNLKGYITNSIKSIWYNNRFLDNPKYFLKDQSFDLLFAKNINELYDYILYTIEPWKKILLNKFDNYYTIEFWKTKLYCVGF